MPILVVAATAAEAAHVPPSMDVVITGMGKTAAAVATARALATRPSLEGLEVVNIGTAGSLRDDVVGLHEPGTVLNHDLNAEVIRSLGYDARERLSVGESDVVLATGDVFVNDPIVRARLAEQAHLVDMEGYAVAWAAESFGVPIRLVKHVSDSADESAMDWPSMIEASAVQLGAWLRTSC